MFKKNETTAPNNFGNFERWLRMAQLVSPTVSNEIVISMVKLLLESPWPPVLHLLCEHEP